WRDSDLRVAGVGISVRARRQGHGLAELLFDRPHDGWREHEWDERRRISPVLRVPARAGAAGESLPDHLRRSQSERACVDRPADRRAFVRRKQERARARVQGNPRLSMRRGERFWLYLYSGKNIAGSVLALLGVGAYLLGLIDRFWFPIVLGLY